MLKFTRNVHDLRSAALLTSETAYGSAGQQKEQVTVVVTDQQNSNPKQNKLDSLASTHVLQPS